LVGQLMYATGSFDTSVKRNCVCMQSKFVPCKDLGTQQLQYRQGD